MGYAIRCEGCGGFGVFDPTPLRASLAKAKQAA